jgi:uncharacterized membrane protein YfcA
MEFGIEIFILLFIVGLLAGTMDTIAGGGGLLTLPALLSVGITPIEALGTNKLQSVFGTFTASIYFFKKKFIDFSSMKLMIFMAFFGSSLGAFSLTLIDSSILKKIIPLLLILIGVYFLFTKNIGEVEKHKLVSTTLYSFTFVLAIGFYDGFFGPGTGSFFTIAFIYFLGLNISTATAQTKVLNFATNFAAMLYFLIFSKVYILLGLVMGIGQIIGAIIGAKLVILKGQKLIRPLIVIVSFVMSIKLLLG